MPVLHPADIVTVTSTISARAGNESIHALQVVCAWPVSGQYGPGSRVLYYVLVAASILARRREWLRNACLAAALLVPAVAALHGIVLAALHTDGVVDMDVYGAFQFCAIGVLAAPVTVKLSTTYFNDRGRNIIFLWTILLLAGLLSLTVEFYRSNTVACRGPGATFLTASQFIYEETTCGLDYCSTSIPSPPYSPMRQGAGTDIYVIPAPSKLTFGTATLLAAGCCIPSILSLVSIWVKILETSWKSVWGPRDASTHIEGTNTTEGNMRNVNEMVKRLLSVVEVPLFGAAVLAILVLGENNLFSRPVSYGTELIGNVGQWAPIAGTALATIGSLYMLVAKSESSTVTVAQHCTCSNHGSIDGDRRILQTLSLQEQGHTDVFESPRQMEEVIPGTFPDLTLPLDRDSSTDGRPSTSEKPTRIPSEPGTKQTQRSRTFSVSDAGGRRKMAVLIDRVADKVSTPLEQSFDVVRTFRTSKAGDWPELPGESFKNNRLDATKRTYNQPRIEDDSRSITSAKPRSRAASFNGSTRSGFGVDRDDLTRSRTTSPVRPAANPLSGQGSSSEPPQPATDPTGARIRLRRDTLEVPSSAPRTPTRNSTMPTAATGPTVTYPADISSPVIVISDSEAPPSPTGLAIILLDQPLSTKSEDTTKSSAGT